jgi:hypothetical protein
MVPVGRHGGILRALTGLDQPMASHARLAAESQYSTGYGASICTWPLVAPWHPELIAAHLLRPLSRALRPGKHDQGPAAVACLMNPDTRLGPIGHLALALGTIGAEGDTRTIAADAFAAAARDGRLQPSLMAGAWLELSRGGLFQAKRLEASLRPLASEPAAGVRVAQCFQLALGPLVGSGTRDVHGLLRLAASLASMYGLFPEDERLDALAKRRGTTEFVSAARALAAATPADRASIRPALLQILAGVVDRAGRPAS